jgi:hypothetical protein
MTNPGEITEKGEIIQKRGDAMSDRKDTRGALDRIEETVDRGATTAEEIHRAISEVPFDALERLGVLERSHDEIKRIHDDTLTAVYDLVRQVNRKVARFAHDVIEDRDASPEAK